MKLLVQSPRKLSSVILNLAKQIYPWLFFTRKVLKNKKIYMDAEKSISLLEMQKKSGYLIIRWTLFQSIR